MAEWRIQPSSDSVLSDIFEGDRPVALLVEPQDAELIMRAISWDSKAARDLSALRSTVEHFCRAFERSSLPGFALIVGDLRAALSQQQSAPDAGDGALRAYAMALRGDLVEIDVALSEGDYACIANVVTRHIQRGLDEDVTTLATAPQEDGSALCRRLGIAGGLRAYGPEGSEMDGWRRIENGDPGVFNGRRLGWIELPAASDREFAARRAVVEV